MKKLLAVLTPQALLILLIFLLCVNMLLGSGRQETPLEERISRVLSSMDGMGEVQVVIATRTQKVQSSLGMTNAQPQEIPCGAVAVIKGASDPIKQVRIIDALCALLGLPASVVSVISGGESS